jgi:hypothetical protein
MQQDAQEIKTDIVDSQQMSMKDLYAFLEIILEMGRTTRLE